MCGICGQLRIDGGLVEEDVLRKMSSALSHRGPDNEGFYLSHRANLSIGLGHRRLSIIDLSEAGRQPMCNEIKTIWMVFNGEIYNFRSLREELESKGHCFSSQTDCEVVIHLYEEEGIKGVRRLIGMFAFAIWDEESQALFLCRDRLGIKPLVFYWNKDVFIFASEIKGILRDPDVIRKIDWDALDLYLTFNYVPTPYTIFRHIRKIKPGHILVFQKGEIREEEYWDIKHNNEEGEFEKDFRVQKNELFNVLEDAVRMRMIADVPVGAFLSGGIDSSIVVGLMARNTGQQVKTYSIGYKDIPMFDETEYARQVATLNNTEHYEFRVGPQDIIDSIPEVLDSFDEPFADSSAVPTFVVSRETGNNVKVVLSGDGGDELFAGYRMYTGEQWYSIYDLIPPAVRRGIVEPFFLSIPDSRDKKLLENIRRIKKFLKGAKDTFEERFFAWNEIFSRELRESIFSKPPRLDHDLGKRCLAERLNEINDDKINRMLYADVKESLPGDMLKKVDAMSMLNSLEVRIPFLDHRVCEMAFTVSGNRKIRKGHGKHILVETFKDILPRSIYNRSKWGFEMPISKWLKSNLRYLIDEYLSRRVIVKQGVFNYDVVEKLINYLILNRSDTSWQIWNLIVFQVWYFHYVEER